MIDPDSEFRIGTFVLTGFNAMIAIAAFMIFLVLVGYTIGVWVSA